MSGPILRSAARFLLVLLGVTSVFVLLRGHNEPGGGFIGGLLLAAALALYALAHGPAAARGLLRVHPRTLAGVGLVVAVASGLAASFAGRPVLTGLWAPRAVPGVGKIGTVLMFDVGVYLVVVGTALVILFELWSEEAAGPDGSAGEDAP